MQNKKLLKGFTIIEIVVVIVIIGTLAAIILVNISNYINKTRDTSIKANLRSIENGALEYYENSGSLKFSGFCSSLYVSNPKASINVAKINTSNAQQWQCNVDPTTFDSWCACSGLKANSTNTICVDSTGYTKETNKVCNFSSAPRCLASQALCAD